MLHSRGLIVELNPLMRPIIERGEIWFVLVKGASLVAAWIALAWYFAVNRNFVRYACLFGSVAYVAIWLAWFTSTM